MSIYAHAFCFIPPPKLQKGWGTLSFNFVKSLTCKIFMILSQNKGFLLSERWKFVKMGLLLPLYCGCITTCIPPVAKTISKTKHKKHAKNKYIHTYIHTYIRYLPTYMHAQLNTYINTCKKKKLSGKSC